MKLFEALRPLTSRVAILVLCITASEAQDAEAPKPCGLPEEFLLPEMPMNLDLCGPPTDIGGGNFTPLAGQALSPAPHFAHLARERKLHPPAPDSYLCSELELADGQTWVLTWDASLAGEEKALGAAMRTLSRLDGFRLVVRVEADDPLRECERVRFELGKLESVADWILALPEESDRHWVTGPGPADRFTPGQVLTLVWQQSAPRPMVTRNSEPYSASTEVREYNSAVELLRQKHPQAPRAEQFSELRTAAYLSRLHEVSIYSSIDWRVSKGSELKAWGKSQQLPDELPSGDRWMRIFGLSRMEGHIEAIEELDELGESIDKLMGKQARLERGSKAYAELETQRKATDFERGKAWYLIQLQGRHDVTRAYHLACMGRVLPLEQRWEALGPLFAWREANPFYFGTREAYDMAMAHYQYLDEDALVRRLLADPQAQESLEQERSFDALREKVSFSEKRLASARDELLRIEGLCPSSPTGERCRVWLELREKSR